MDNKYRAIIKGSSAKTLRAFYTQIAKNLNFPDYFGRNLDALEECLSDLSWLEENEVILEIDQSEKFLSREIDENRHSVLEILKNAQHNQTDSSKTFKVVFNH